MVEYAEAESGRPECAGPLRGARRSGVGRTADRATGRKRPTGVRSTLDAVRALVRQRAPGDCQPRRELPSAPWRERSTAQGRST